ncbi:MAG: hypothetical protein ACXAB2_09400 [Candidatus Hodarchaeales archaeon]|jgi:hypothetical protein
MSEKKPKTKRGIVDKIKESGKDFMDGIKEELNDSPSSSETKKKRRTSYFKQKSESIRQSISTRMSETSTPEEVYYSTTAWFWAMFFVIIICVTLFLYGIMNSRFLLVGLLALIAMPFLIVWCLIHMIPTVKVFGFTIFDRNQLSFRRQLTIGKEIARFFSREFLEESPMFAFLLFTFIFIFILTFVTTLMP